MDYTLGKQSAPAPEDRELDCGTFFPPVPVRPFYDEYRIPAEIPAEMVLNLLRLAIARCMDSLETFRAEAEEAGYTDLLEITDSSGSVRVVDGIPEKELLWRRAVYCEAKADALKETQTVDRREKAENAAKSGEETEDKYREWANLALRQICYLTRAGVDLI